jgi:hypothetical protein
MFTAAPIGSRGFFAIIPGDSPRSRVWPLSPASAVHGEIFPGALRVNGC